MTAATHPSIVVLDGPEQGTILSIDEVLNDFVIGAGEGCHLLISGDSVSPLHANVFLDDEGSVLISDTNSRDGVFVNGTRVMEQVLADGDEISLGDPASSACRRLRFVALGSETDVAADLFLPEFEDVPLSDALSAPDPIFGADIAFTNEIARPTAAVDFAPPGELAPLEALPSFDAAPSLDDLSLPEALLDPLPEPIPEMIPEPAPLPPAPVAAVRPPGPASGIAAPPVKSAGFPKTSAAGPAKGAPGSAARPSAASGDADDPLAGLAESLGGSSDDKFVPPPPVASVSTPATAPRRKPKASSAMMVARIATIAAVLGVATWFGLQEYSSSVVPPVIDTYLPSVVEPGQTMTITGTGFGSDVSALRVSLGKADIKVLDANQTRINITIPESLGAVGSQTLPLRVTLPDKTSSARMLKVAVVPKITSLSPRVAAPGDEVVIAGRWLSNPKVKPVVTVAGVDAEVLEAGPTVIRMKVPAITAVEGQKLSVRVAVAPEISRESPLIDGHLPFIESLSPERAFPGEVVTIAGLGFSGADLGVRVGSKAAVVLAASDVELRISVPGGRISESAGARDLVVEAAQNTSSARKLDIRRDSAGLYSPRFFAEALEGGRVAVSCEMGPVMVLGADEPSRRRAHEAAAKLNALSAQGRTNRIMFSAAEAAISAPGAAILVVAPGDGAGAPRSLAAVWSAQLTDMFDLFLQGRRPGRTIELSPDGKVFVDIFGAARRRSSEAGVSQGVLSSPDPAWSRSLATLASSPILGSGQASYVIDGYWAGVIEVKGAIQPRRVEISLTAIDNGVVGQRTSRQGRLSTDVTLQGLSYSRRELRFSFIESGETLNYFGRLDGDTIDGAVTRGGATVGKLVFKLAR